MTSSKDQNKKTLTTLESAQCGLEIIFKVSKSYVSLREVAKVISISSARGGTFDLGGVTVGDILNPFMHLEITLSGTMDARVFSSV